MNAATLRRRTPWAWIALAAGLTGACHVALAQGSFGMPTQAPALHPQALKAAAAQMSSATITPTDPLLQSVLTFEAGMPLPDEVALGDRLAAWYLADASPHPSVALQSYVNALGRWISLQSPRPELPWSFTVVQGSQARALALPGGQVLVPQSLVDRLVTEPALAAHLAEQIAQVCQGTVLRDLSRRVLAAPQLDLSAHAQAMFGPTARGADGLPDDLRDDATTDALAYAMLVRSGLPAGQGMRTLIAVSARASRTSTGWWAWARRSTPVTAESSSTRLDQVRAWDARNTLDDAQSRRTPITVAQRLAQIEGGAAPPPR